MDWNEIITSLKKELIEFGKQNLGEYLNDFLQDEAQFWEESKEDIQRWTHQLILNQITEEEFKSLLGSLTDSLKLEGLKQAGIAQIRLKEIRDGVIEILINSFIKIL